MATIEVSRFQKIYALLWGLFILLALTLFIFYKFGYRFTSNFTPAKVGSIEITSNQKDLKFYLNNREKKADISNGMYTIRDVIPGVNSLIVSKDFYWPWSKTFRLSNGEIRPFYVFLFPMNGIGLTAVPRGDQYLEAVKEFKTVSLPEVTIGAMPRTADESLVSWLKRNVPNYKISSDETTALFSNHDALRIAWISESKPLPHYFCIENPCRLEIPVLLSNQPIKNVEFYPNRNDLILFSAGSTIYGIEVDSEGTQNFQPVYNGKNPYLYISPEGVMYIKDGDSILRANI